MPNRRRQAETLPFQGNTEPTTESSSDDARLVVICGPRMGRCFHVHDVPVVIGRAPEADFHIGHASVSRAHCSVWHQDDGVFLRDIGSKNGTMVNGRVTTHAQLHEGDIISMGETALKFVCGGSVEAKYHEALYDLATLDNLTQLLNRREFRDSTNEVVTKGANDTDVSVVIFDVDHFKQINDKLGHDKGDEALRLVAATVREKLRAGDHAGRLGGDEFGVLLRNADPKAAMEWCEDLRATMEEVGRRFSDLRPHMTISVGVATWCKSMKVSRELMRRADMALLTSKAKGKNQVSQHA